MKFILAVLLWCTVHMLFWVWLCAAHVKVEGLAAAVDSLESSHKSSLGLCVGRIEEHVEEACVVPEPSGGTPGRKSYPRPDKFRCSVGGLEGGRDVCINDSSVCLRRWRWPRLLCVLNSHLLDAHVTFRATREFIDNKP